MLIRPEEQKHSVVVTLSLEQAKGVNILYARIPIKYYPFIDLIKDLGFKWNGAVWYSQIVLVRDISASNKIVHLGYTLLENGFIVEVPEEYVERVLNADFENPRLKYITSDGERFFIDWQGGEDLWYAAKQITGFFYDGKRKSVPATSWKELLDFSEKYHVFISDKASKLLQDQREKSLGALLFKPKKKKDKPAQKQQEQSSSEILDEFLDED